jgi:hypothetical protein
LAKDLVFMSEEEVDRLVVIQRVLERRVTRVKAGELLGLCARQVTRLCEAYQRDGVGGLVSKKRGCVGSRKLPEEIEACVVDLVREFYGDFGPTLAREKLEEIHGIRLAKETVRKCMVRAGIWLPKESRLPKAHQPRHRRHCFGELVQIDGCQHDWFEGRGPYCTLLVYVDDATGRHAREAPSDSHPQTQPHPAHVNCRGVLVPVKAAAGLGGDRRRPNRTFSKSPRPDISKWPGQPV